MKEGSIGDFPIDVLGSGSVTLGPDVSCDGFHADQTVRVQTHVHSDHMADFSTSKHGEIIMTPPTLQLLEYEDPSLTTCGNVHQLRPGEEFRWEENRITLLPSTHMLGAVQVAVQLRNAIKLGYSSDFSWPLDRVIEVDGLVIDATYGKPSSDRAYTQEDVEEAFADLVRRSLQNGPVHIMADMGPAERSLLALTLAEVLEDVSVIGDKRFCRSAAIYRQNSYPLPVVIQADGEAAMTAMANDGQPFVRYWGLHGKLPNDGFYDGTVIRLTKYRAQEPVDQQEEMLYTVGFSNHADFSGTMEYVKATGASFVVTDNVRGKKDRGLELAKAIRRELRIKARVSSNETSLAWGE